MAPVVDAASASSHGHIEAEFAHALGNLRAFLDGQLAYQPQQAQAPPIALPSMSTAVMLAGHPVVGDPTAFQRAHIQTLRSLEQWSTVLNDYLNLLDGCCATHPIMRQRVAAITRRLLRLQLSGNLPQPTTSLYPVPMASSSASLHPHQMKRNAQPVPSFNSKHGGGGGVHPGASYHGGPCVSNGTTARGTDQHIIGSSS